MTFKLRDPSPNERGLRAEDMLLCRHHDLRPRLLHVIDKKSDHGSCKDEAKRDGSGGGEDKAEAAAAIQDRDHGNRGTRCKETAVIARQS